ncbi:MAG TPA: serine/threonine-protein kinase [Nannocystaceae bacterium]|nr:serine/threonine-protein kinase [Nannocystaceae bacterium]
MGDARETGGDSFSDVDSTLAGFVAAIARPQGITTDVRLLTAGDVLSEHLVIERVLGRGGMGVVYLARDRRLDRDVAVKLVARASPDAEQQLELEARAMAKLRHPNVLVVHEVGVWKDRLYLAMEYVEGTTLRGWLAARPRTWRAITELLVQAASGLHAAHAAGLAHRDFKPENVLIGDDRAHVADFGLARNIGRTLHEGPNDGGGTLAYMAPELFRGGKAGPPADQFAFGVTCWEALCNVRPYGAIACEARSEDLRRPSRKLPAWLRRVLARLVAIDPRDRFPDMDAVVVALRRGLVSSSRRKWTLALGTAASVTAVVGLVLGAQLRDDPCAAADPRIARAWTSDRRAEIGERFASAFAGGERQWPAIEGSLDTYLADLAARREQACRDVEGREHGEDDLARTLACFDERFADVAAVIDTLATADHTIGRQAEELLARLPELASCSDREYLVATVHMPVDPELRAEVSAVRAELRRIGFTMIAAPLDERRAAFAELRARAAATEHAQTMALVDYELGALEITHGGFERARPLLLAAYYAARGDADDNLAALAAVHLAYIDGLVRRDVPAAMTWLEHARADVRRKAVPPVLEAEIETTIGGILLEQGDHEQAIVHLQRGVEAALQHAAHPGGIAEARGELAAGLAAAGQLDAALAEFGLAIEVVDATLGPDTVHAARLHNNRGQALIAAGRHRDAIPDLERALAIELQHWDADAVDLVAPHLNLGIAYAATGDYAHAKVELERALQLSRIDPEDAHDGLAELQSLAWVHAHAGDHAAALAACEELLATRRRLLAPQDLDIAAAHHCVASELRALQRNREAMEHVQAALRMWQIAPGLDAREADAWCELAKLERDDRRIDAAKQAGDRVLELGRTLAIDDETRACAETVVHTADRSAND